ncbi:hypothetical protein FACS1894211_06530 [Clostridia bacterium]|nr:hypothetical protein FACS1894211_06530 [Clostridia bacterium]
MVKAIEPKVISIDGSRATLYLSWRVYRISLTRACIILLGRPERVKLLLSSDYKSIAIQAATEVDRDSFPVPQYVYRRSGRFRLSSMVLVTSIWQAMAWDYAENYLVNGTYDEVKNIVKFDLTSATNERL